MSINSRYGNLKINRDIKILFVDDDAMSHLAISTVFSQLFNSFGTATNTTEAFEKLTNTNFDCIITEIEMKNRDELTFIQKIREKDKCIPIIVLTSSRNSNRFIELIHLGISGIISKPIQHDELLKTVLKTIDKIELLNTLENKK